MRPKSSRMIYMSLVTAESKSAGHESYGYEITFEMDDAVQLINVALHATLRDHL